MFRDITVVANDRQVGKTTMLLDVALANARRGLTVDFRSPSVREAECAYALARTLVPLSDMETVKFDGVNGMLAIRYQRGRVRFIDRQRGPLVGAKATDLTIDDDPNGYGGINWRDVRRGSRVF
ncbi:hypothetical protein SEA_TINIBUG_85 [Mycobacterium Phage TiniBug]|nr:hypothetical protein SEA_TINIBUG_85 [Mycobacterium Phage TiniBug]